MAVDDDLIESNLKAIHDREAFLKKELQTLRNTLDNQYAVKANAVHKELAALHPVKQDYHEIRKVDDKIPNSKGFTVSNLTKYRQVLYDNLIVRHGKLGLKKNQKEEERENEE